MRNSFFTLPALFLALVSPALAQQTVDLGAAITAATGTTYSTIGASNPVINGVTDMGQLIGQNLSGTINEGTFNPNPVIQYNFDAPKVGSVFELRITVTTTAFGQSTTSSALLGFDALGFTPASAVTAVIDGGLTESGFTFIYGASPSDEQEAADAALESEGDSALERFMDELNGITNVFAGGDGDGSGGDGAGGDPDYWDASNA